MGGFSSKSPPSCPFELCTLSPKLSRIPRLRLVAAPIPEIRVSGLGKADCVDAIAPHFGKQWFQLRAALAEEAGLRDWLEKLQ